ncbi:MAG: lamin tail domain-containing protein, partial [Planctomycetes bacterium]|nr:lamin tail domain-containing protein [Planctomycetota bacterium]
GPDGSWHLYEYVSTAATWTAARTAAHAKTIGGAQGHLVTIHSDAENSFIRGIISGNTWIGLTDDVARGGTEYGNTSAGGAPTEGQVPSTSPTVQRGAGFVWENGELFTYHLYNGASIWQASQPGTNANTQDYVRMGTAGTWDDGTASTSLAYVIEYDLNLASLGPNWSILEAHGATTLTNLAEADTLLGGGGTKYTAPWINFVDPQDMGTGQFAGNIPFGGDTSADDNNFAIQATAYVKIATGGTYTFAVNSDDGFRLTINGGTFSSCSGGAATINGGTLQRDGTTIGPSYGVITLAAGEYRVQLTYFECGGGAHAELYAAPGTKTAYDSTFKLVGDTLSGGLALWDIADLVTTNVQTAMKGINPTAYVRIPFTVADPASISTLNLQMKYDDGFVAYLNGVEVARANAPGTLNYNAAATASDPDTEAHEYDNYNITAFKSALVAGTNVLAIQGLNASASDLDFLILPQLTDTHSDYNVALQRYFMTPTPRTMNGTGTSDLGPIVTDLSVPPVSPADTDDILVTATVKASLNPVQSVSLYYRVNYGTEVALTMYDDGAHGDGAAGDKVYGASIPNVASSPGQMVRWYVSATDNAAHTTRVPVIPPPPTDPTDEDRTPEYLGTMISPGLTSTLPILYWFVQNTGAATTRTGTRCSVYYLGEFYDNLFVRDRGGASTNGHKFEFNSSYDFRFALDQARVKEFNLNFRGSMDDAYVRPVLAFEAFRDIGTPACIAFPMRIQQNGALHSSAVGIFIEQVDSHFLEREGLDPDGLLYKMTNDVPAMQYASSFEKKSDNLDNTALQAFLDGLHLTGTAKTNYILDHVDLAAMIDYIVANNIVNDNDDAQKNYYLYQDGDGVTSGTGKWTMLPWDKDLTFGMHYFFSAYMATDPQTHPFFGDSEHPKKDGPNAWNWMIDAVLDIPEVKQMFLRRFRTAMDEFLGVSGTPSADRYFETRLDELYAQLTGDPQVVGYLGNLTQAVANLKTLYLEARRNHLFIDHSINTAYPDYAGIPASQIGTPAINFGAFEVSPVSGNQDEEYIELRNPNSYAVDISGWKLRGGVDYTFDKGTVIPAGGSLYVSANERAFRARTTGPRGGQGLFIQGNYNGHLSPRAEPVRLLDLQDNTVATLTYTPTTTATQQYLRVTEVMYHPADGDGYDDNEFEYIELKNIGPGSLSITNVKFTEGVTFTFPSRTLASGERVLVVANTAAFQSRYGSTYDSIIAGQFATPPGATSPSRLDNSGDRIPLEDPLGNTILSLSYSDNWFTQTDGLANSLV